METLKSVERIDMAESTNRFGNLSKKLTDARIWFLIASLGIMMPLIVYAYMGIFSRYQADDYCLAWNGTARTFLRAQTIWYQTDSSRYAATFIFTLSDKLGRWTVPTLPAFVLAAWLIGTFWLIHLLQKKLNLDFPRIISFFIAELVLYFVLLLVPNLYQVLYWRSGMVVYLLPIVILTYLAVFLLVQVLNSSRKRRYLMAALALLFFFINGGFSETIATIQVGMLSLIIFVLLLSRKRDVHKWAIYLLSCALIGSLLAMTMLYFSPATRMRQELVGSAPDLISLVRMSLSNAFIFLYITLGDKAFQFVILMITAMLAGYVLYSTQNKGSGLTATGLVSVLFLMPITAYLWIVCVCAPFAYGESTYPEARVLLNATVIMVVMIIVEGLILGISMGLLHQRSQENVPVGLRTATLLLLVFISLFPLYSIRKVWNEIPKYQQRAEAWDIRDEQIRSLAGQGQKDITVTAFESFAGILEISPTPSNWVNGCAALYYGVHSITAKSP